jgi:3-deoxy-D-manno-octulosonate 8-phosphate phosphatase (KDO 8-P phosphatase)
MKNNLNEIKLLILDIDGVLTDGTKVYDEQHKVLSKRFFCKDFTAIKRFIAAGIKVVMLSGDNFNKTMAEKRNIDFYCSRNEDLSLDKSRFIELFENIYNIPHIHMAFVGDDYFDLSMFNRLYYTFCPSNSPSIIRDSALYTLNTLGGAGVIVELYDLLRQKNFLVDASEDSVANLDRLEITSKEMK